MRTVTYDLHLLGSAMVIKSYEPLSGSQMLTLLGLGTKREDEHLLGGNILETDKMLLGTCLPKCTTEWLHRGVLCSYHRVISETSRNKPGPAAVLHYSCAAL